MKDEYDFSQGKRGQFYQLEDIVYGDEWNNELIRRADTLDSGESKGYTLEEFRKKTRSHINEITDK